MRFTKRVAVIIGVLLLDFGAGLSHAANQSSAFALRPEARGRVNSRNGARQHDAPEARGL